MSPPRQNLARLTNMDVPLKDERVAVGEWLFDHVKSIRAYLDEANLTFLERDAVLAALMNQNTAERMASHPAIAELILGHSERDEGIAGAAYQ